MLRLIIIHGDDQGHLSAIEQLLFQKIHPTQVLHAFKKEIVELSIPEYKKRKSYECFQMKFSINK